MTMLFIRDATGQIDFQGSHYCGDKKTHMYFPSYFEVKAINFQVNCVYIDNIDMTKM